MFLSAILKGNRQVVGCPWCRPVGDCTRRAMAVHILSLPEQEPPSIAASARSSLSGPPRNLDFIEGIYGSNESQQTTSFWNVYQKMQASTKRETMKPRKRKFMKIHWKVNESIPHGRHHHLYCLIARHSMRCCWKPMKQRFQGRFLNPKNYL